MFEFLQIITLQATFTAGESGRLPAYLGSTIRGILGHCLREFVCGTLAVKCFTCGNRRSCDYVQYFCNTGGKGGALNPFVIYPRVQGKTEWEAGDECVFDITLFGSAALNPGIYLDALLKMEEKGWGAERLAFTLKSVTDPEAGRLIYAGGQSWLRNLIPRAMKIRTGDATTALVTFDTPVRIVSGKELFTSLPFDVLMRFVVGRISLMTQIFTGYEMEWDEEAVLRNAANVKCAAEDWRSVDFTRYSINQKGNKLELPSRMGWALYRGDLSSFIPYLEAGKYMHVGKNTTIGFGHYEVYYDRELVSI